MTRPSRFLFLVAASALLAAPERGLAADCGAPAGPIDDLVAWLSSVVGGGGGGEPERPRTDTDGDGVPDRDDAFPNNHRESVDTDGDGVGDESDAFPEDPEETRDSDCDGVGDNADDEFDGEVETEVDYPWSDGTYGWDAAFDLTSTGEGVFTATVNIYLDGERDEEREAEWEEAVEEMWGDESLTVDVNFVDSEDDAHSTVEVRAGDGWANAGTWFEGDDGLTVAHEVGHHLGLFDEYRDRNDADREIGESDNIMRTVTEGDNPRAYPRHHEFINSLFDCP